MLIALLSGFLVSYILAIPPGPVTMVVLKHTLQGQRWRGVWVAFGAGFMDIGFCLIAVYISSELLAPAREYVQTHPSVTLWFRIGIVGLLVCLGAFYLLRARTATPPNGEATVDNLRFSGSLGAFGQGLGVAFANIANPPFIPSLVITTGAAQAFLLSHGWVADGWGLRWGLAVGFGCGAAGWLLTLQAITVQFLHAFPARFLPWVQRIAGIVFIGFASYLVVSLLRTHA